MGASRIAESYLLWQERRRAGEEPDSDDADPDWWAVDLWLDPDDWDQDEVARESLLLLIERADDDLLGNVAAGPLENYVSDDEARLEWIEEHARRSPRFRQALGCVWVWNSVTDRTFARLEEAAERPLPHPDRR